jgi:DNA polymerase III alpha subunit
MRRLVIASLAIVATVTAAHAIDPRHPDWPCQQIMVPSLSAAAFWTGAPIDDIGEAWQKDDAVNDLVQRLAARRTPIEEAEKSATDFVAHAQTDKQQKAALLFAGLFATLNGERSEVMDGIERFAKRQQELRTQIQAEITQMRQKQDTAQTNGTSLDDAASTKLGEQIAWDTRVYDERRHTISYVCEVPANIERRLGTLARAIQQALE